ncbi:hypothetical protein H9P43_006935 [Blastocladiella emersonii ATCC 22665]|nr:hypothetical protein H9P43_006935 [Blastocladiella emersonii ATCC 22665]
MLLVGQAGSGVVVCLVQLALQLARVEPKLAASLFFFSALLVVLVCRLLYSPIIFKSLGSLDGPTDEAEVNDETSPLLMHADLAHYLSLIKGPNAVDRMVLEIDPAARRNALLRAIMPYALTVVANVAVTLALFPGFASLLRSTSDTLISQPVFTAAVFLVFNLGDVLGRALAALLACIAPVIADDGSKYHARARVAVSLARVAFVPLFLALPLIAPDCKSSIVPRWTGAPPATVLLLVAVLAATSGMVASLAAKCANNVTINGRTILPEDRVVVGRVMTLATQLGLVVGAGVGVVFVGAATA